MIVVRPKKLVQHPPKAWGKMTGKRRHSDLESRLFTVRRTLKTRCLVVAQGAFLALVTLLRLKAEGRGGARFQAPQADRLTGRLAIAV